MLTVVAVALLAYALLSSAASSLTKAVVMLGAVAYVANLYPGLIPGDIGSLISNIGFSQEQLNQMLTSLSQLLSGLLGPATPAP